ncbi:MAG: HlyD family type I secretion periplasmic adaptor subunit, partial [Cyanobacteriota bacterium]|nr:HlyD family type I secretion periplasmic adaptor subunit [Cyanobacteriota bacterium]
MTSTPVPPPHNNPDTTASGSQPLALRTGSALLARLPGIDDPDAIALVGRKRLSQALELEEKPDNRYLRLTLYGLGAAALIFFPWAALTPITQVVRASGEVIPQGDVTIVQHLEGGIVAKVNVQDGDPVSAGEVMLELRPTLVESEYRAVEQQLKNMLLQQKQLQAAIRGENKAQLDTSKVSDAQRELLLSRMANKKDKIEAAEAQIRQKQAEINGLNDQIAKFERELVLYQTQRNMFADLVNTGAASRLSLVNAEQQEAAANTKLAELRGTQAEATQLLAQAEANLRSLRSGLRMEESSQMAALVNEEAVLSENIKKLRNQLDRTKITAPIAGTVSDLRYRTAGAVVAPGAMVLKLVPSQSLNQVEARVRSSDIGFVSVGQQVEIKLQPYDFSIYGSVAGKVVSVAPSTIQDPDDRQYYYRARIQLDQQYLDPQSRRYPIQVGMPLIAEIKGPKRSVLQYLFQPFTRTL